jgi:hypothetical protein
MNGLWYSVRADDDDSCPDGIMIQGVHWTLGGQPPRAKTKGWGNLSFLRPHDSPN